MRDYGKVHSSFWSSKTIGSLSDDGKLLALYLLTSSHSNIAGAFRLPDGYASEDLGWDSGRVKKGFAELFRKGFATRCDASKWVWVMRHFHWNPLENPNQKKAAVKVARTIPLETAWLPDFSRECLDILGENLNPSERVSEPFPNQYQEQYQEQEQQQYQEQKQERVASPAVSEVFDHWRSVMNHPKAKIDPKREKAIKSAIGLGYTVSDLCLAIDGCRNSPWHMGKNDRATVFDGLDLILRDAAHIDKFIREAAKPAVLNGLSAGGQQAANAAMEWIAESGHG